MTAGQSSCKSSNLHIVDDMSAKLDNYGTSSAMSILWGCCHIRSHEITTTSAPMRLCHVRSREVNACHPVLQVIILPRQTPPEPMISYNFSYLKCKITKPRAHRVTNNSTLGKRSITPPTPMCCIVRHRWQLSGHQTNRLQTAIPLGPRVSVEYCSPNLVIIYIYIIKFNEDIMEIKFMIFLIFQEVKLTKKCL